MSDRLVTFDIWDTCLVRATGTPHTIFALVARTLNPGLPTEEVAKLVKQRVDAEVAARDAVERGECTLSEIETALARAIGAKGASTFIEAELKAERASIRPVAATLAELKKAREAGATIAFASDMYLPAAFLRELLEAHGFARPGDPVYVSGERRANKRSGTLFEIIRQELKKGGRQWTHHGDNSRADIGAPRKLGIKAVEVRLADWSPSEQRILDKGGDNSERIAGAIRAVRLAADPSISQDRAGFLSGVAAPWLLAITTRILAMARDGGIQRIYFVARDGDIPLRLARILAPEDIECRYLFGSRKAWCFPGMFNLQEECTSWLRLAPMKPGTLLNSLGFSMAEHDAILTRCGIDSTARARRFTQEELAPIWADIQSNGLEEKIVQRASAARESCIAYLRSQKLFDGVPWAIADVGWLLHGQAALKRITTSAGASRGPAGCYFMIRRDRRPPGETGPAHAWIKEEKSADGELFSWMSPVIEECFLTSSDPSVTGYRTTGNISTPTHAEGRATPEATKHAAELRTFAEGLAKELKDEIRDPEFLADFESSALHALTGFLREPDESEVAALRGLQHATAPGAGASDSQPLVRSYTFTDAFNLLLRRAGLRRPTPEHDPYWHSGSMAISSSLARAGMKFALSPNPLRRSRSKTS